MSERALVGNDLLGRALYEFDVAALNDRLLFAQGDKALEEALHQ